MDLLLTGLTVYTETGMLASGALAVRAGKIAALETVQAVETLQFPSTYHLVPGFIDMHVHGANGHDVMDADVSALKAISYALAAEGTTAFLATTMTADVCDIERALVAVRDFMLVENADHGAAIIGVHLEGPFLAASKTGAQRGDKIIPPNLALVHHWQKISDSFIRLITLAPEQTDCLAFIHGLVQQKIIASIGHTNATYAEAMAAIEAGCTHATHLFNAMRGMHQREPGAVTAALLSPKMMVELILDGVHLHPAIVDLTWRMKGKDKIILVTDAMRAKCLADGCYDLGGQSVQVKAGRAELADGTLAGSVLKMSTALQNMMAFTGCGLSDVLKMTSENPARALGLFDTKGSIRVGKDADLVVLDDSLEVVMTICSGEIKYRKGSLTFT
jgi:N-acetylglucosamine-6-phosphate deacetylase